ncbi:hypothetical protein ACFLWA_05465 [Chloroflexota bacterium]
MSDKANGIEPSSLYARLVGRPRSPWITAAIGLVLLLAPVGAAFLDGELDAFLTRGYWQPALLPAAVILYILIVAPIMARLDDAVIEAFRSMVQIDGDAFDRLVREAYTLNPVGELAAMGIGSAFGLWVGLSGIREGGPSWFSPYLTFASMLMFGLLAWTIYAVLSGTRHISEIHRQPLSFDILDTRPFEPVGRQSLISALVFVGGIVIGMVFGLGQGGISAWQNWLLLFLLFLVPVLVFFLNMRDSHRVLAAEKERVLDMVQAQIREACRRLSERIAAHESAGSVGAEVNALVAYEDRLRSARTWPYNTAMLRTPFVSVIIPGGAALVGAVSDMLFR